LVLGIRERGVLVSERNGTDVSVRTDLHGEDEARYIMLLHESLLYLPHTTPMRRLNTPTTSTNFSLPCHSLCFEIQHLQGQMSTYKCIHPHRHFYHTKPAPFLIACFHNDKHRPHVCYYYFASQSRQCKAYYSSRPSD
jgi:hypothetical protein